MTDFDPHPEKLIQHNLSYQDYEAESYEIISQAFKTYIQTIESDNVPEEKKQRIKDNLQESVQKLVDHIQRTRESDAD